MKTKSKKLSIHIKEMASKTKSIVLILMALSGMMQAQNNYIPGLSPSAGNIGVNLPSAPTEYNLQVRGSMGMGYGSIFGVTNTGWPTGQTKIFQTAWDATNGDYLAFFTPGALGSLNTQEKLKIINNGNIGMGVTNPAYKLHVETGDANMTNNQISSSSIYFEPTYQATYSKMQCSNKFGVHAAIQGYDLNNKPASGGYAITGIGVFGKTERTEVSSGNVINIGVYGKASGPAVSNIGGVFNGDSFGQIGSKNSGDDKSSTSSVFGVWASASGKNGVAGYFNGSSYSTSMYQSADKKLTEEVKPISFAINSLKLLKPQSFIFRIDEFADLNLPQGEQIGLDPESLQEIFPSLVKEISDFSPRMKNENGPTDFKTYKTVNYTNLIPLLIAGIQEQQKQIDEQNKANEDLRNVIAMQQQQLEDINAKSSTDITVLNAKKDGFNMEQNIPNPFSNETVINYNLPQSIANAYLAVYDLSGKQIMTFPLDKKESASLTIGAEKLAAGIYIYSIIADGKVMDSKRMVITEK